MELCKILRGKLDRSTATSSSDHRVRFGDNSSWDLKRERRKECAIPLAVRHWDKQTRPLQGKPPGRNYKRTICDKSTVHAPRKRLKPGSRLAETVTLCTSSKQTSLPGTFYTARSGRSRSRHSCPAAVSSNIKKGDRLIRSPSTSTVDSYDTVPQTLKVRRHRERSRKTSMAPGDLLTSVQKHASSRTINLYGGVAKVRHAGQKELAVGENPLERSKKTYSKPYWWKIRKALEEPSYSLRSSRDMSKLTRYEKFAEKLKKRSAFQVVAVPGGGDSNYERDTNPSRCDEHVLEARHSWSTAAQAGTSRSNVFPPPVTPFPVRPTGDTDSVWSSYTLGSVVDIVRNDEAERKARPSSPSHLGEATSGNALLVNPNSNDVPEVAGNFMVLRGETIFCPLCLIVALIILTVFAFYEVENYSLNASDTTLHFHNEQLNAIPLQSSHAFHWELTQPALISDENASSLLRATRRPSYNICTTRTCRQSGFFLSSLIVRDADPCENFYHVVCSRWKSQYENTKMVRAMSVDEDLVFRLEGDIQNLLESQLTLAEEAVFSPLQVLTNACINVDEGSRSLNPLLELLLTSSLEGFPFTPPVRSSLSAWRAAGKVLVLTGAPALLSIAVSADPFDNERGMLSVDLPELLFSRTDQDSNETFQSKYEDAVRASMQALEKPFVPAVYIDQAVNFALHLQALVQRSNDHAYQVVPLKDVPDIRAFFSEISTSELGDKTPILLRAPSFVQDLLALVRRTESYVVMNFLGVHVIVRNAVLVPGLSDYLTKTSTSMLYEGPPPHGPRWRTCLRFSQRALPYLFLHASKYVATTVKTARLATTLVEDIRKSLMEKLNKVTVMDEATRVLSRQILAATKLPVFAPSWLSNPEKLSAYRKSLSNVTGNEPTMKVFSIAHAASNAFRLQLPFPDVWTGHPLAADCWYDLQSKTVYVPTLLFDFSLPDIDEALSLQLVRAGVRIITCILRMLFEGVSTHYSRQVVSISWWTPGAKASLREARDCLLRQNAATGNFTSILEKVAAVAPAVDIYRWYTRRRTHNRADVRLSLVEDFNTDHLFFIYFALGFCHATRGDTNDSLSKRAMQAMQTLNVTLWNAREFSDVFGCRREQHKMCSAWQKGTVTATSGS